MSYEFAATHNTRAACLELCEAIAERFDPAKKQGLDTAALRRVAKDAIASGQLIPPDRPNPNAGQILRRMYDANGPKKRTGEAQPHLRSDQPAADPAAQSLKSLRAEAKLDRIVSMCRNMAPLRHGELKRIARAEGVDYDRLKHRLSGRAKTSRL